MSMQNEMSHARSLATSGAAESAATEHFFYDQDCPDPNVALHPGVSAVIFDTAKRILIMKRPHGGYWCLPGGRMDIDESAQECCIRETREETGLQTEVVRLISVNTNPRSIVVYPDGNVHRSFVLCFEARVLTGSLNVSSESEGFYWLAQGEIDDFKLIPDSRFNMLDAWTEQTTAFIR